MCCLLACFFFVSSFSFACVVRSLFVALAVIVILRSLVCCVVFHLIFNRPAPLACVFMSDNSMKSPAPGQGRCGLVFGLRLPHLSARCALCLFLCPGAVFVFCVFLLLVMSCSTRSLVCSLVFRVCFVCRAIVVCLFVFFVLVRAFSSCYCPGDCPGVCVSLRRWRWRA